MHEARLVIHGTVLEDAGEGLWLCHFHEDPPFARLLSVKEMVPLTFFPDTGTRDKYLEVIAAAQAKALVAAEDPPAKKPKKPKKPEDTPADPVPNDTEVEAESGPEGDKS
jgi:hypothetical protein